MDTFRKLSAGLIVLLAALLCAPAFAQTMPQVTPVSSVPVGPAPGGSGVVTKVTYEMRLAANDATATAAANDARYVSRAVTIAGPTMGGIVRGVVAGGSRLLPWVAAALTAYEIYKWYTDNGVLTQPGSTTPGPTCTEGGPFFVVRGSPGCSLPGAAKRAEQPLLDGLAYMSPTILRNEPCMPAFGGSCSYYIVLLDHRYVPATEFTTSSSVEWRTSGAPGVPDPDIVVAPAPVTDTQLGDLAQQHPEWWPDMLRDPQTGNPLITPEIADDMDALKQQIAPEYGVDPTTLPETQPDPDYQHGVATPRETSLPQYCAWAAEACNYYKFVEDNWPKEGTDPKTFADNGCDVPPSCTGDEVMCAIAEYQQASMCNFGTKGSDLPPDTGTHVVSEIDNPDVDLGDPSTLDQSGLGFGASCPFTDFTLTVGNQSVTIPWSGPVCEYGPWMRAFILILAALACARIIGGASSGGLAV